MWLFTPIGFFSAVRKPGEHLLTVRARSPGDLENLRDTYMPELSPTQEHGGTDYPYRARISPSAFGLGLMAVADDLTYSNFKNEVAARQGHTRAHVYGKVWQDLLKLEDLPPSPSPVPEGLKPAFGGVVIDESGRVLLVEPKNHFDGYVWTFPKGRPEKEEPSDRTAVREVREEAGVTASVVCPIPGAYRGGTTLNRYFLMRPDGKEDGSPDQETESVTWVSHEVAHELIGKTTNDAGRHRDRKVLQAGFRTWMVTRTQPL